MKISQAMIKLSELPGKTCPECRGKGEVLDQVAVGAWIREQRYYAGVSLRETARRMEYTPAYISDLEKGKRTWSKKLLSKYLSAIKK